MANNFFKDYKNYLIYLKYVAFSIDNKGAAHKLVEWIKANGLLQTQNPIKVLELGTGTGAISIPTALKLQAAFPGKNIEWCGAEKSERSMTVCQSLLDKICGRNGSNFWTRVILENRTLSDNKYAKFVFKELERKIRDISNKITNQHMILRKRFKNVQFNLYKTDLEKIAFMELADENNELKQFVENGFHILFVPFVFQHIVHWRRVFAILEKQLLKDGILVNGILGRDWLLIFNDYLTYERQLSKKQTYKGQKHENHLYAFWKNYWQTKVSAACSLRDFRGTNIYVFEKWLEQSKYRPCKHDFKEDATFKITINEMKGWSEQRLWSPFIQSRNSPKGAESNNVPEFPEFEINEQTITNFKSCHRLLVWEKTREHGSMLPNIPFNIDVQILQSLVPGHVPLDREKMYGMLRAAVRLIAMAHVFFENNFEFGTVVMSQVEPKDWYGPCIFINSRKFLKEKTNFSSNRIYEYLIFKKLREYQRKYEPESYDLTTFFCCDICNIIKIPYLIEITVTKSGPQRKVEITKEWKSNRALQILHFEINTPFKNNITMPGGFHRTLKKHLEEEAYLVVPYGAKDINNFIDKIEIDCMAKLYKERKYPDDIISPGPRLQNTELIKLIKDKSKKLCEALFDFVESVNCTHFIGIPLLVPKDNGLEGKGILWLSHSGKINEQVIYDITKYVKLIFNPVIVAESITEIKDKQKKARKHALRSATIAIIMDTFSHNIAAHSIPSTIDYISKEIEKAPSEKHSLLLRKVLYSYQSLIDTSDFWMEGIRSERSMSGQIMSLYDILCDFADNSLFLGTISETEGFTTVIIKIKIPSYDEYKVFTIIDLDRGTIRWGYNKDQKPAFDRYIENKKSGNYNTTRGKNLLNGILVNEDEIIMNKDNLDKLQEIKIYFPGGISGKKALYTIFENVLRNGKHLKERNKHLVLNIEIQSKDREISPKWDFKISLEGKTKEPAEGVKKTKDAFEIGIMKDDGSPNMGGSGQMLICGGMLNELTISEIHEKARKVKYKEFININKSSFNNLEYTTYLWKGAEFEKYSDIKESLKKGKENIHRFKILIISEKDRKEIEQFCKNMETYIPLRLIENEGELYKKLYQKWLGKLNISLEKKEVITIKKKADIKIEEDLCGKKYQVEHNLSDFSMLSCRSHGILVKNFTEGNHLINTLELIEILETKIEIHDSRVYNFIEGLKNDEKNTLGNLLREKLNMKIYPDLADEESLNQVINNSNSSHFMVVHISPFISVLNQLNSQEKKGKINVLKKNFKNYNFLIFTSGKGRKEKLINYSYNIRSIDFANFQSVVNITRRLKGEEAFALKYGFVKVLLGS